MAFPINPVDQQIYTNPLGTAYKFDSTRTAWLVMSQTLAGPQGNTGIQGITGLQGIQGTMGEIGQMGYTGLIGDTGFIGATGLLGGTGLHGDTGLQGETGVQGLTGFYGLTGLQGVTGVLGIDGQTGIMGVDGVTGIQGVTGILGIDGQTGIMGVTGFYGLTGIQGVTGILGIDGQTGIKGVTGLQGVTGILGIDGQTGIMGVNGETGIQGVTGFYGLTGIQGPGGTVVRSFVQANGFVPGDVVRLDSTGGWTLAQADTPMNAEALGLVQNATATDFTMVFEGYINNLAALSLTANTVYFLSADNTGKLTPYDPNITNPVLVSKPMLETDTTATGYVLSMRGIYGDPSALGTFPYRTITADYTIGITDYSIFADSSHVPRNVQLPNASTVPGKIYNVKKIDPEVYSISVYPFGAQKIDNESVQVIASPYSCITVQSDGSNWWII